MMITYLKLLGNNKGKNHLILPSRIADDATTLCGATLTNATHWKRIDHLEGDECPRCADRAFWGETTIPAAWAKNNVAFENTSPTESTGKSISDKPFSVRVR
jgi:hypothetical protein